ncbi:MAG: alpha/beta hydrolase [Bacteroidota bacterium]
MRLLLLFCGLLFLTACKKTGSSTGTVGNAAVADSLINVSYGTDAHQKMDIYLPANRSVTSTKVLFLIHGGGWNEGDKADFTASVAGMQTSLPDYAFININYRLVVNNQNLFPTQENDVKAAVDFIFTKRNEYLISDKWAFLGASAGGHLALLQAYKYASPVKPKAVISFFGPTDLTSLYNSNNPLIALLLLGVTGTMPSLNPTLYQQSSPINFVTAQSPPTILLQGGADPLVPVSQPAELTAKLNSLGVANQYVFYPTEGHGWTGLNLLDSYTKIIAFLQLHVN